MGKPKLKTDITDAHFVQDEESSLWDCKAMLEFAVHVASILAEEYVAKMKQAAQAAPQEIYRQGADQ